MAKRNSTFEVKNPNAFFDFKNDKIVLTFHHTTANEYPSSKPLMAFVAKCVNDRLTGPLANMDTMENFLEFTLPLSKLLDDELRGNTVEGEARGKNLTATADRRELYQAMADEFEDMAKRLRALKYD